MKTMNLRSFALGAVILLTLVLAAACSSAQPPAASSAQSNPPVAAAPTNAPVAAAPTTAPTAASAPAASSAGITVQGLQLVKNDKLGQIIADGDGRTLYFFMKDTKNTSNCYDKCAQSWPAALSTDKPALGDGMSQALLGTTTRKDGSTQLTYNGFPLYYFAGDKNQGDVNGQALGKVWWVASGEGNPIKPAALAVTTNDRFGKILTDDAGRTLYLFLKDSKDTTVCYDKCEQSWPPLVSLGQASTSDGIDTSLLGTIQRKDGTTQVTYNGMPVYYFGGDQAKGDVKGQGLNNVWYVIGPDGNPIKQSASAAAPASASSDSKYGSGSNGYGN